MGQKDQHGTVSLGIVASNGSIVPGPYDRWVWSIREMATGKIKLRYSDINVKTNSTRIILGKATTER
jgi:hypothetical protein